MQVKLFMQSEFFFFFNFYSSLQLDDTCKDFGEIKKNGFITPLSDVMIIPSYVTFGQIALSERRKDGYSGTVCR
jgi:hypothetical protein